jgi:thioredoxin-dependent peroxiredoxin
MKTVLATSGDDTHPPRAIVRRRFGARDRGRQQTMVCTKQFCSYRDRADDFATLNATVVGISSQDLASHDGFAAKHSLNVPLLADVDKQVAKSYSAFSSRLGVKRAVMLCDP